MLREEEDASGFGFELAMELKEESASHAPMRKKPPPATERVKNPIVRSRRLFVLQWKLIC